MLETLESLSSVRYVRPWEQTYWVLVERAICTAHPPLPDIPSSRELNRS